MSDRDELRARIEHTLAQAGARGKDRAQAIIDDLHLEAYDFTTHDGHTTNHVHGWWKTQ